MKLIKVNNSVEAVMSRVLNIFLVKTTAPAIQATYKVSQF